jgi:N-acetylmuramoyl-L-alanine amidase
MTHPVGPAAKPRRLAALISLIVCAQLLSVAQPASAAPNLAGMAVFIDPGHNGAQDASINRQVPNGRGGTKECDTSGTATSDGYPEHAFTWDVALQVQAAMANAMHPDAEVSIHADGGPPSGRGFHVNFSSPPLNAAQSGPAMQLAQTMRDSLADAGMQPSTYIGSNGMYGRADLAGLNLAQNPAVLVELGNMKNAAEAARMESPDGRAAYAAAVTQGIVAYLSHKASAN